MKRVVVEALGIAESHYRPDLEMSDVAAWDSVAHLNLIFAIEEAFQVRFHTDIIPQLDSLTKIRAAIAQGNGRDRGTLA